MSLIGCEVKIGVEFMEKVLVGITAQTNSRRLIDKGTEVSKEKKAELHILHVQKGDNIFFNEEAPRLLQELYQYGSERGGQIHALCGENVGQIIIDFIKENDITSMVVGERPKDIVISKEKDLLEKIKATVKDIEIIVLKREE